MVNTTDATHFWEHVPARDPNLFAFEKNVLIKKSKEKISLKDWEHLSSHIWEFCIEKWAHSYAYLRIL